MIKWFYKFQGGGFVALVLASTGALIGRPNGRNFYLLKEVVPQLRCDGLEFMFYETWHDKIEEIKSVVKSLPLPVVVFHLEKQIGEHLSYERLDEALSIMRLNCGLARDLGAKKLVLHLWNGVISDSNINYNIEAFGKLNEIALEYGLLLTCENVVCNKKSPFVHLCTLVEKYPDISFTFDTKMAEFHKELPLLYDEKYRHVVDNIAHLHVNDCTCAYKDWSNLRVLPVGHGIVDFDRFFSFIKEIGYDGTLTTEATCFDQTGFIHIDRMNSCLDRIREYLK